MGYKSYKSYIGKNGLQVSLGNTKTGHIPAISLTPVHSCRNGAPCSDVCYALKRYQQYPTVRNAWNRNLELAANRLPLFFDDVCTFVANKKPRFFRYHVSGDIPCQGYLYRMTRIARIHKKTRFLCFTKKYELDFSKAPKNLSIIFSIWPGLKKPRIKRGVSGFAYLSCDSRKPVDSILCPGNCENCGMCFDIAKVGKPVCFDLH